MSGITLHLGLSSFWIRASFRHMLLCSEYVRIQKIERPRCRVIPDMLGIASLYVLINNSNVGFLIYHFFLNPQADDNETYSTKEFLADISNCGAKRVIIVADQTNTDVLMTLLKQSGSHSGTILFTSGSANQVTTNGELTRIWTNHSHPMACLKHIQQVILN